MACRIAWTLTNWTRLGWNGTMLTKFENKTYNIDRNGPSISQYLEWHSTSIAQHSRGFNEATFLWNASIQIADKLNVYFVNCYLTTTTLNAASTNTPHAYAV